MFWKGRFGNRPQTRSRRWFLPFVNRYPTAAFLVVVMVGFLCLTVTVTTIPRAEAFAKKAAIAATAGRFGRAAKEHPMVIEIIPIGPASEGTTKTSTKTSTEKSSETTSETTSETRRTNTGTGVTAKDFRSRYAREIIGLSDLRYDEWIANDVGKIDSSGTSSTRSIESVIALDTRTTDVAAAAPPPPPPPPSRYAYRMATADIASERWEAGAVTFLALRKTTPTAESSPQRSPQRQQQEEEQPFVGAAELSPIEFEGALSIGNHQNPNDIRWYVTDVVTSSRHRRMGIANELMNALERYAYFHSGVDVDDSKIGNKQVRLYLHVRSENDAGMAFYTNPDRGYAPASKDDLEGLDVSKLEENAGIRSTTTTTDDPQERLLCKTLTPSNLPTSPPPSQQPPVAATAVAAAAGFGNPRPTRKKQKRAKRKTKS